MKIALFLFHPNGLASGRGWPHRLLFLMSCIVLTGGFLRVHGLDHKDLWLDEVVQVHGVHAVSSVGNLFDLLQRSRTDSHPPLSHVVMFLTRNIKNAEFGGRFPSVIFGTSSLVVTYLLGKALFSARTGLLAALLLSLSVFHLRYSQEARPYAAFGFFSLLSFYYFVRMVLTASPRTTTGLKYTLATAALSYTHYFSFVVIGGQIVAWGAQTFLRSAMVSRENLLPLRTFALMLLGVLLLYVPWLPGFLFHYRTHMVSVPREVHMGVDVLWRSLHYVAGGGSLWFIAWVTFLLAGITFRSSLHARELLVVLLWLGSSVLFVVVVLGVQQSFFHPRYIIFTLPVLLILISRGVNETIIYVYSHMGRADRRFWIGCCCLLGLAFAGLTCTQDLTDYYRAQKTPWRAIVKYIAVNGRQEDIVLVDPHYLRHPFLYYAGHKDIYDDPATLDLSEGRLIIASSFLLENKVALSQVRRMWFLARLNHGSWEIPDLAGVPPKWVTQNFRLVKKFSGLEGDIGLYSNFQ